MLLKNCFTKLCLCRTIAMFHAIIHKSYSRWDSLMQHFTINEQMFKEGSVPESAIHFKSPGIVSFNFGLFVHCNL